MSITRDGGESVGLITKVFEFIKVRLDIDKIL